jgi:hypothetical protein
MGKLLFQAIEFGRGSNWSVGEHYLLRFTTNGNLELWADRGRRLVWESGTASRGDRCAMQSDGNLVIYNSDGEGIWASGTSGNAGAILAAQDDGNLVIYASDQRKAIWETGTSGK